MTIFRRRIFLFIAGFASLLGAQYLIAKTDSPVIPLAFALPLQDFFRFDLPNLENVIVGVVLLIVASILILLSLPAFSLPQWDQSAQHLAQSGFSLRQFLRRHVVLLIAAAVLFALLIVRLSHADVSAAPFFLWIIVLALLLIVAFRYDRRAGTPLSLRLTRWDMLWIGGLLLFALLIGTYQLDRLPNSLVSDEGNFWTRAKTIADGQEIQSFFDVAVYSYPLASSFYQGAILRIFGYSLASWRFSSVLAGVLVVIPLYLLARDLFDRRTAVIAGLLLVTLPYLVAFERLGYNNAQAILPVTLALYLLYLALQRESIFYFALGGLAAGLGFYTYTASRLGLLVGAAFLGLLLVVKLFSRFRRHPAEIKAQSARQFRHWLAGSAVFVAVGLATVAPHLVYTNAVAPELLRYKTLESLLPNVNYALSFFPAEELFRDYAPLRVGNEIFFYRLDLYARLFVRNIARSLLVFHDSVLADAEYLTSPLSGTVGVFFYTVGLLVALRNFRRKEFALMLMWWFGGVFFLSIISTFPARFQHMIPIIPMIALFTAVGLTVTVNAITERIRFPRVSLNQRSFGVVAGVLLAVIVGTNLYSYFVQMPQRYLPDMENIMSFTALNLRQPTHLVYVYATVDRSNWTPWMITYIPNQATYQTIKVDEFGLNPPLHMLFATGQSYIVFFDQDAMMPVLSMMRLLFPTLQAPPVIYHDISNRVLGMSYTFVAP